MVDDDFEKMVDVCCKAHEVVRMYGTSEMQALTEALLRVLAKEAARERPASGGDADRR